MNNLYISQCSPLLIFHNQARTNHNSMLFKLESISAPRALSHSRCQHDQASQKQALAANNHQFHELSQQFAHAGGKQAWMKQLQQLTVYLEASSDCKLPLNFKRLTNSLPELRALKLNFSDYIEHELAYAVGLFLSRIPALKVYSLDLSQAWINQEYSHLLCALNPRNLRHLSLNFYNPEFGSGYDPLPANLKPLFKLMDGSPGLHQLELDFSGCYMDKNSLKHLSYSLSGHYNSLQQLNLDLSNNNYTSRELNYVCLSLAKLTNLTKLTLTLTNYNVESNNQIKDRVCTTIAQALMQLSALQTLELNLNNNGLQHPCKISNHGIMDLAAAIAKLTQLKALKLDLSYQRRLTDKSLRELSQAICQLPCLVHVHLEINNCNFTYSKMREFKTQLSKCEINLTLAAQRAQDGLDSYSSDSFIGD